jgi:hypothetical protein
MSPWTANQRSARARLTLPWFLAIFVGGGLLILAFITIQHLWQARHPAVEEHLAALNDVAAKRMGCAKEVLKIIAEEPTRARAEGCGQSLTFRWGSERIKRGLPHWHQIDPSCHVQYLGCSLPCE